MTNKTVTIVILARNKAHVLPEYLQCIENLDYPKDQICLQVRTNDNTDRTKVILDEWLERMASKEYINIDFDTSPIDEAIAADAGSTSSNPHEWNTQSLHRIARIRQESLEKFCAEPTDYYFVVDCDNFIAPYTLTELVRRGEPIVAPMLDTLPSEHDQYSNFFAACDPNGYFAASSLYTAIRSRQIVGAIILPVVHCTYLIERNVIERGLITYIDGSERYEFVVFSDSARKSGVRQVLINDRRYGYLIHHLTEAVEAMTLPQEEIIYREFCRRHVLDFIENPGRKRFGEEAFYSWYGHGGGGSGHGSGRDYTARFRTFLEDFMKKHDIRTVVDYGCGDWQWASLIDWSDRQYRGFDIVPTLVARLKRDHEREGISFDVIPDVAVFEPPDCDLLICKDVLQHLPNAEAAAMIRRFASHAKHILWVNDRHPDPAVNNADIPIGSYRYMDLTKPPFSIEGETVFEFGYVPDHKIVFWHQP